jgi:hypothetical protein
MGTFFILPFKPFVKSRPSYANRLSRLGGLVKRGYSDSELFSLLPSPKEVSDHSCQSQSRTVLAGKITPVEQL